METVFGVAINFANLLIWHIKLAKVNVLIMSHLSKRYATYVIGGLFFVVKFFYGLPNVSITSGTNEISPIKICDL